MKHIDVIKNKANLNEKRYVKAKKKMIKIKTK